MTKHLFLLIFLLSAALVSAQQIAITLDDAPTADGPLFTGAQRAERILKALADNDVNQVAFFVLTSNITQERQKRLEQYSAAGHLLGNHTHTHKWIHNIGTDAYIKDIQKADSILRPLKGFTPWFRYPFLDEGRTIPVRDSIRNALTSLELINGYVTVDHYEWYLNALLKKAIDKKAVVNYERLKEVYINHIWESVKFYDGIAHEVLGRSPKHVLLLHENDLAALYLDDLIKFIKSKGWEIISPQEAYNDDIARKIPNVLFNGQGRIAAIAKSKGIKGHELVQESEDEEYLDKLVTEKKVFE